MKASIAAAAVTAAAVYFLYGTEKGELAREKIGKAAGKLRNRAMEAKDNAMRAGGDLAATGKEVYEEMSSLFKEKCDQLKALDTEDLSGLAERLRERWEETKEDIEKTLDDASED